MNLHKQLLTENDCYKAGSRITVKGIMVHSTGANNPNLRRYVAPDDGLLGVNNNKNDWNRPRPDGRSVCVHAFIGKLADGSIATYQTLPWDYRGWHCGGSGNNTHIGFEICEDDLTSKEYFEKVYKEAAELCAYLCKLYNLTEKDIVCHREGADLGIASYHADVLHWFPKFGKSMDNFRADVKALLDSSSGSTSSDEKKEPETTVSSEIKAGSLVQIAKGAIYYSGKSVPNWVINLKWRVAQVKGDRAVLGRSEDDKYNIMSPINTKYLSVDGKTDVQSGPAVGDIVEFIGGWHYIAADSTSGSACTGGKAKITAIKPGAKHPYHLIKIPGGGSTVYGWVSDQTFKILS